MTDNDPRALLRNARVLVNARKSNTEHPHRLGTELAHRGDFEGAVDAFQRAIEETPDAPWSHLGMGEALVQLGRLTEARTAYLQAIRFTPTTALALRNSVGAGLMKVGDLSAAADVFRDILVREPGRASTKVALARVLLQQGFDAQIQAATLLASLERVEDRTVIITALNAGARQPGVFRLMAKSFAERNEHERAINMCHLALAHDSSDRRALLLLADEVCAMARSLDNYLEPEPDRDHPFALQVRHSFDLLDPAADANPDDAELMLARARLADTLPDGQRTAATCWSAVTRVAPNTALWHREFGDRLAVIGDFDEAGQAYDRAVALGYEVF